MTLRTKYQQGINKIFDHICQVDNPTTRLILGAAPLVRNASIQMTGAPGTGKSTMAKALGEFLFVDDDGKTSFSTVNGHQDITASNSLYWIQDFNTMEAKPLPIMRSRISYFNEINRVQDAFLNNLLAWLSTERKLHFQDQEFLVADGKDSLTILDYNLSDCNAESIGQAFRDRIDVEIIFTPKYMLERSIGISNENIDISPLSSVEVEDIWNQVETTAISDEVELYSRMAWRLFSVCIKNRGAASPLFQLSCDTCSYKSEPCSSLSSIPASRPWISMIKFARAIAWIEDREVSIEDIDTIAPYVFSHRLEVRHEIKEEWPNVQSWIRDSVISNHTSVRKKNWVIAIGLYLNNRQSDLKELAHVSNDLVITWLFSELYTRNARETSADIKAA